MSSTLVLRMRYVVAAYGRPVAIGLVILASIGCIWTALGLLASPTTEDVVVQTSEQTVTTTLTGSAVITGDTPFYNRGTTLKNNPVYFTDASPDLTLHARTTAPSANHLEVTHHLSVVLVGSIEGDPFWHSSQPVGTSTESAANGSVTTSSTFDVGAFAVGRLRSIRKDISSIGQLDVSLRLWTTYSTDLYDGNLTISQPLTVGTGTGTYTFSTPVSDEKEHSTPVTQQVTRPPQPSPPTPIRGVLTSLALVGGIVVFRANKTATAPRTIERRLEYERYREWISNGRIPAAESARTVELDSIADLVETGIDSGKRVIHDDDRNAFAVIDGTTFYQYEYAPREAARSAAETGNGPETATQTESGGRPGSAVVGRVHRWISTTLLGGNSEDDEPNGGENPARTTVEERSRTDRGSDRSHKPNR